MEAGKELRGPCYCPGGRWPGLGGHRDGKKWIEIGNVLEVGPLELADGFDVGNKGKSCGI